MNPARAGFACVWRSKLVQRPEITQTALDTFILALVAGIAKHDPPSLETMMPHSVLAMVDAELDIAENYDYLNSQDLAGLLELRSRVAISVELARIFLETGKPLN